MKLDKMLLKPGSKWTFLLAFAVFASLMHPAFATDWYVDEYMSQVRAGEIDEDLDDYPKFCEELHVFENCLDDGFYSSYDFEEFCEFAGYEFTDDEDGEEAREEVMSEWLKTKRDAAFVLYDKLEAALKK